MRTSGGFFALVLLLLGSAPPALAKPSTRGSESTSAKPSKKARAKEKPKEKPCFAPEVQVVRRRGPEAENRSVSLTFCDGAPNLAALDALSVLARPRDVERPEAGEIRAYQKLPVDRGPKTKRRKAAYVTPSVMRVHPGLLLRLQRVANKYPGKSIEIISGHRPDARDTSRHHHGKALDMRVAGVSREALRDFLRTFPETGVGYYPNSFFVHMDVREDKGYWVDRSGPGEAPDYGPWPPKKADVQRDSQSLVTSALSELNKLDIERLISARLQSEAASAGKRSPEPDPVGRAASRALTAARRLLQVAEDASEEEDDDLSDAEIERIRKQARAAIDRL